MITTRTDETNEKTDQEYGTQMATQLGVQVSDMNCICPLPHLREVPLVEVWGQNMFDTDQKWDLALLADAIGAKSVRSPTPRASRFFCVFSCGRSGTGSIFQPHWAQSSLLLHMFSVLRCLRQS